MTRTFMTTTAALTLMASTALASTSVKKIDVDVDLDAIENAKAVEVWQDVSTDLETAIAKRLVSQLDDDGARIIIDIDEVSLANNFEQAYGFEDAVLQGDVSLRIPGLFNNENYTLTVSSDEIRTYLPETGGTEVPRVDSEVFYQAMIEGFADNVAAKLQ